jgi:sirohydrochlorin ferrochelatase
MSERSPNAGLVLFAHGSTVDEANESVRQLARQIQVTAGYRFVRAAFLDCAEPQLSAALEEASRAGLERVIVVPYFLVTGIHISRDLPRLVTQCRKDHPSLEIEVCQPLEGHPLMAALILERVRETLGESKAAP